MSAVNRSETCTLAGSYAVSATQGSIQAPGDAMPALDPGLAMPSSGKLVGFSQIAAVALIAALSSTPLKALANSYNLICRFTGGASYTLIVRDWLPGIAAPWTTPEFRIVASKPGETAPVEVMAYTSDKIQVSFAIEVDRFPGQRSTLTLTIDRNTGAANERFEGPWRLADQGTRWREVVGSYDGTCERDQPRF